MWVVNSFPCSNIYWTPTKCQPSPRWLGWHNELIRHAAPLLLSSPAPSGRPLRLWFLASLPPIKLSSSIGCSKWGPPTNPGSFVTTAQWVFGCPCHKALVSAAQRPTSSSDAQSGSWPTFSGHFQPSPTALSSGSLGVSFCDFGVTMPEELAGNHFKSSQYLSTHSKQEASPLPPTQGDSPCYDSSSLIPPANTSTHRPVDSVRTASLIDSSSL